jgi:hypothetical protein
MPPSLLPFRSDTAHSYTVLKTSAPPVHSLTVVKMFSEKSVVTSAGEHWQRRCLEKLGATQRDMGI